VGVDYRNEKRNHAILSINALVEPHLVAPALPWQKLAGRVRVEEVRNMPITFE
jgi:hypothetical protein